MEVERVGANDTTVYHTDELQRAGTTLPGVRRPKSEPHKQLALCCWVDVSRFWVPPTVWGFYRHTTTVRNVGVWNAAKT